MRLFVCLLTLACLTATPAFATMEDYPSIRLQGLDKSVGRTVTLEAKVGSTIQYGPLFIKINACRKASPIEKPESAAFLQIWEVPPGQKKSVWVFSGWMFASSPALSAMDHPVYDIWVLDCTGRDPVEELPPPPATKTDGDVTTQTSGSEATQSIPTDSEAEEEPQQTPNESPETLEVPQAAEPQAEPVPEEQPKDGVTAYDFMNQQAPQNTAPTPYVPGKTP